MKILESIRLNSYYKILAEVAEGRRTHSNSHAGQRIEIQYRGPGNVPNLPDERATIAASLRAIGTSNDGERIYTPTEGKNSFQLIGPPPHAQPKVEYWVVGGIMGRHDNRLIITPDGRARLGDRYPRTELVLAPDVHRALVERLRAAIEKTIVQGTVEHCLLISDSVRDVLTVGDRSASSECLPRNSPLIPAVRELDELAKRIENNAAPWNGLQINFSLPKDHYGRGEPITLTAKISNPTNQERRIAVIKFRPIVFRIRDTSSALSSAVYIPVFETTEKHDPSTMDLFPYQTLILTPGSSQSVIVTWDQKIEHYPTGSAPLSMAHYMLSMSLDSPSGRWGAMPIPFDVVNTDIPVSCYLTPDRDDATNENYTFKIVVRNWTMHPVTLLFSNTARFHVELSDTVRWDKGKPIRKQLYTDSTLPKASPIKVVLSPGETRVYQRAIPKTHLNLPENVHNYHIKARLLDRDNQPTCEGNRYILWNGVMR